jgi:hypothetical protein
VPLRIRRGLPARGRSWRQAAQDSVRPNVWHPTLSGVLGTYCLPRSLNLCLRVACDATHSTRPMSTFTPGSGPKLPAPSRPPSTRSPMRCFMSGGVVQNAALLIVKGRLRNSLMQIVSGFLYNPRLTRVPRRTRYPSPFVPTSTSARYIRSAPDSEWSYQDAHLDRRGHDERAHRRRRVLARNVYSVRLMAATSSGTRCAPFHPLPFPVTGKQKS